MLAETDESLLSHAYLEGENVAMYLRLDYSHFEKYIIFLFFFSFYYFEMSKVSEKSNQLIMKRQGKSH
jgi:hypothetical protein